MDYGLIIPAFVAGIFTFLAPCTLPLIPVYLGIISGTGIQELRDPTTQHRAKRKVFLNGLFFVLGFTLVFVLFGILFAFIGSALSQHRALLSRISGIFVVLFGFFMIGTLKIPFLEQTKRIRIPMLFKIGHPLNSTLIGLSFGLGWTPCLGPILGSILFLASTTETVAQGAILLLIFSSGLALPFLLLAILVSHVSHYVKKLSGIVKWISVIGGLFLIFLGILLLTNSLGVWVSWFLRVFDFMNFDAIFNYL